MASCLLLVLLARCGWAVCDQPSPYPREEGRGAERAVTDEGGVGGTLAYLPSLSSSLRPSPCRCGHGWFPCDAAPSA